MGNKSDNIKKEATVAVEPIVDPTTTSVVEEVSNDPVVVEDFEQYRPEKQFIIHNKTNRPIAVYLTDGSMLPISNRGNSKPLKKSEIKSISTGAIVNYKEV